MREGLGFVWGSCRLGKGLICRMRLGGFKVDFVGRCPKPPILAQNLHNQIPEATRKPRLKTAHPAQVSPNQAKTDPKSTLNPPNCILHISPLPSVHEPQTNPRPSLGKASASPTLTPNQPPRATLNCHEIKANRQVWRCGRLARATVNYRQVVPNTQP